jgi:hypothetical protein
MRDDFSRRVDAIEEAYEFMLAYAAQGLAGDAGAPLGGQLRELMTRAASSLSGIGATFAAIVRRDGLQPQDKYAAFGDVLDLDARASLAAIELVLAQPSISSQTVDNLNASIHLRALLTDLFLLDEVLKNGVEPRVGS